MGVTRGVRGERGRRRRGRRRQRRRQHKGEGRRAVLRLFFLGEGGRGALASSFILRRSTNGSGSREETQKGGGGEGENDGNVDTDNAKEEDAARSFIFFHSDGEGDEGPLASSSPICHDGSGSEYYLYKQLNINMLLINNLSLLIMTLTSAAQR